MRPPHLLAGRSLAAATFLLIPIATFASVIEPGSPQRHLPGIRRAGQEAAHHDRIYTISPPDIFRHDIGQLDLMVSNLGVFGNPGWVDEPGAEWRGGEYLYGAALWIGAIASDNLPYVSTGLYEYELRPSLDPVDTIYESYEGIPGGNRLGYSEEDDDDGDGLIDEDFHNGKDDDGDGAIDEDFAAISEQMFSCEYWDYTEEAMEAYPDHRPLGIKVRQKSVAWSIEGIDPFIGVEFDLINEGNETLRHLYMGIFMDADIGPRGHPGFYGDDGGFVYLAEEALYDPTIEGCNDIPVRLQMAYMYDIPDGEPGANGGDVEGFLGLLYLGSSRDLTGRTAPTQEALVTAYVMQASAAYPNGDPRNDVERYEALSSGRIATQPTWAPDDCRVLVSVGPFPEFRPGETIRLHFAFVVGEGYYDTGTDTPHPELGADGQPSDQSLLANARRARLIYHGRWKDVDGLSETGVDGRESCVSIQAGEPFHWDDTCGHTADRTLDGATCADANAWVDADCDPCTPNPYHEGCVGGGCERLLPWYPAPAMRASSSAKGPDLGRHGRIAIVSAPTPAAPPLAVRISTDRSRVCALEVLDASGRLIRDLGRRQVGPGTTAWTWDGRDQDGLAAASGVYFLRAIGDGEAVSRRLVVLRP